MTTNIDRVAEVIAPWCFDRKRAAQALAAANLLTSEPHVVTSVEELDALPVGSVVAEGPMFPLAWQKWHDGWHSSATEGVAPLLPVTVLTPATKPTAVHWRCDCVPDAGPPHCHLCDTLGGHPIEWDAAHPTPPGRPEAVVKAEALREAAEQEAPAANEARRWLLNRATAIENGANDAR